MKEKVMQGKPYAGNPHVRFDEGAGAPRHSGRSALLYNKIIKVCLIALMAATTTTAFARHHHHHHSGTGFAIGAGILGAGLLASTIYDATHPAPPPPVVVAPQPQVVVQQPQVVVQQPQVVVQQPVGHYETRIQNVWVEGRYIDQPTPQGTVVRTWQPGHYEPQQTQVWVTP